MKLEIKHTLPISKVFYFQICILFLFTINSCTFLLNNPDDNSGERKLEIYYPVSNSAIGYSPTEIEYSVSLPYNILFLELYINGQFIKNIPPLADNKLPPISLSFDTSYIGKKINYYLVYYDQDGTSSKSSDINDVTVNENQLAPYPPFDLRILELNNNVINLLWKDTSRSINRFDIYRKNGFTGEYILLKVVDGNVFNTNDEGLLKDSVYFYKIKGINDFGESEFSAEVNTAGIIHNGGIYPPSALNAEALGTQLVKLTWVDNSDNETFFRIERKSDYTDYTEIGNVGPDETVFTDSGSNLYAGGTFYYRVIVFSSKDSAISNIAEVTTFNHNLLSPVQLTAQYQTSLNLIQLNWENTDSLTALFEIWRKRGSENYSLHHSLNAVNTVYLDSDIQSGNTYYYKVRGYYNNSFSDYSNEVQVHIP